MLQTAPACCSTLRESGQTAHAYTPAACRRRWCKWREGRPGGHRGALLLLLPCAVLQHSRAQEAAVRGAVQARMQTARLQHHQNSSPQQGRRSERSRARHGLGAERLCKQRRWRQDPLDPCPALHACANGCGRGALGQGGHVRGVWVGPWGLRPADLGLALKPLTSAPRCLLPPTPVKAWVLLASLPAGPHLPGPGRRGWRFVARSRKLSQAPARASDAGRAAAPPAHSSPARILGGGGHA